ncbi:MAG: hypothetical protein MJZ68_02720 [archaeon]|nr:hypothetical protein [archaeon]
MEKLPNDFEIAVRIYRYNQRNEPIYLTRLVEDLEGRISRATISKNLDQMFDLGIITGGWRKSDNGKWIRTFDIADNAKELISAIAEKYPGPE